MSETKEMSPDKLSDKLKEFACEMQQCYYECLSECSKYKPNEHKYLIQNIGYAMYGAPENKDDSKESKTDVAEKKCDSSIKENKSESTTESNDCSKLENSNNADIADADIADIVDYDEDQKAIIDKIYKKICECIIEQNNSQVIYCGMIYNIIISKENVNSKKEDQSKQQADNEGKNETEKSDVTEENNLPIFSCPIFTIRKNIKKQSNTTKTAEQEVLTEDEMSYETWYLDTTARVYKNWTDYKESNRIPKCIMVLPKDGCYQADPEQPITEDYSTVWLEIVDSPACSFQTKFCHGLDIASTVIGIGGMGLCVASMFTPVGPIVGAAGLLANSATGAWCIGRSTHSLIDRSNHEESINPFSETQALPHWLGLAGSATGLGVIGGSTALSMAAARGMTVNIAARAAFNAVQCSSILINGAGIFYQGYCMYDRYRTEQSFSYLDTLDFVMHALFFTNSVINIQFAHNIIENTQGKIVKDYKQKLRKKSLRKKFNRFRRKASENNTNKISENAEVICHINNRKELQLSQETIGTQRSEKSSFKVAWSFDKGMVKINDIPLINPFEFVACLITKGIFDDNNQNGQFYAQNNVNDDIVKQLMKMFRDLIKEFYANNNYTDTKMPNFEPLLREIGSMNISENCVKILFKIATKLIKNCKDPKDILPTAMQFIWQYCKENLKQWGIRTSLRMQSESGSRILQKIIIVISEASEMFDNLFDAFLTYIKARATHVSN